MVNDISGAQPHGGVGGRLVSERVLDDDVQRIGRRRPRDGHVELTVREDRGGQKDADVV